MNWLIVAFVVIAGLAAAGGFRTLTVMPGAVALLYRRGSFENQLDPGFHRWFDPMRRTTTFLVPTTRQTLAAHDATVLTRDQFSFRIGFTPICQITDARAYHESRPSESGPWPGFLGLSFPELHATLMAAAIEQVAKLSLDEFLADPLAIAATINDRIGGATPGAAVVDLLVTSITMPPEIRKMFTEVERAKRESLAALERAKGEQASLRALANAARSMQANPQLGQLRALQMMETAKGNKTFILGQAATVADAAPKPD